VTFNFGRDRKAGNIGEKGEVIPDNFTKWGKTSNYHDSVHEILYRRRGGKQQHYESSAGLPFPLEHWLRYIVSCFSCLFRNTLFTLHLSYIYTTIWLTT